MLSIDLNCDMGESTTLWRYSIDKDFELLKWVSSINIACGYHAGDTDTMKLLIKEAIKKNIAIGGHPSFPDKENFGRTNMQLSRERISEIVYEQIIIISDILKEKNKKLHHVKPHGALYNMAAKDRNTADAICEAVKEFDKNIILYGLSGSELIAAGKASGLETYSEVFADRTYQDDGSLTSRKEPNALIDDAEKACSQVLQMIKKGTTFSVSGKEINIKAETICIHSDDEHAVEFAKKINQLMKENDIAIKKA